MSPHLLLALAAIFGSCAHHIHALHPDIHLWQYKVHFVFWAPDSGVFAEDYNVRTEYFFQYRGTPGGPGPGMTRLTLNTRSHSVFAYAIINNSTGEDYPVDKVELYEDSSADKFFIDLYEPLGMNDNYTIILQTRGSSKFNAATGLRWVSHLNSDGTPGDFFMTKSTLPGETRNAFPCIDQPKSMAPIDLTVEIYHAKGKPLVPVTVQTPLSFEEKEETGWVKYSFGLLPNMTMDAFQFSVLPLKWYEGSRGAKI